jgi:hypothetical protein
VIDATEQNNRFRVPVGIDEQLQISLPVQSGAVWQLADPVGPELRQLSAPAGSSGTQVLAFQAVKPGTVTVQLHSSSGGTWYAVVLVWKIQFSPKNFVPVGRGRTSPG